MWALTKMHHDSGSHLLPIDSMRLDGLSPQQLFASARILHGANVLLTGPAGSGKSELLKRLVEHWNETGVPYALCATTGIAALQIGGQTLHSYFKVRPSDDEESTTSEDLYRIMYDRFKKGYWAKIIRPWKSLRILVIDEVSMIRPALLSKLSGLLQLVRASGGAFGGIQCIFVGDFFQLPPVGVIKYLFEYAWFYDMIQERLVLDQIFRQTDTNFTGLLNRMRINALTNDDYAMLESRVGAEVSKFGVTPTELWSTKRDVEAYNQMKLGQLDGQAQSFARHSGLKMGHRRVLSEGDSKAAAFLLDKFLHDADLPETLVLKGPVADVVADTKPSVGAQVMLTYNLDQERGLVNGSRGVVVGFEMPEARHRPASSSILTDFDTDETKAYIRGHVAPKVTFLCGDTKVTILVPYVRWSRTLDIRDDVRPLAYAWSIPLKLAWATTVHKSQGQSLDCVSVCLDRSMFADGQAYVAVSRVRSFDGLTITKFDRSAIKSNEKVAEFYKRDFGYFKTLEDIS